MSVLVNINYYESGMKTITEAEWTLSEVEWTVRKCHEQLRKLNEMDWNGMNHEL